MLTILVLMAVGVGLGYLLRGQTRLLSLADRATTWAVYGLLFLLGISVGANNMVMRSLGSLGWQALWLSMGAVVGSVAVTAVLQRLFFQAARPVIGERLSVVGREE